MGTGIGLPAFFCPWDLGIHSPSPFLLLTQDLDPSSSPPPGPQSPSPQDSGLQAPSSLFVFLGVQTPSFFPLQTALPVIQESRLQALHSEESIKLSSSPSFLADPRTQPQRSFPRQRCPFRVWTTTPMMLGNSESRCWEWTPLQELLGGFKFFLPSDVTPLPSLSLCHVLCLTPIFIT